MRALLPILVVAAACKAPPLADEAFDEALVTALTRLDDAPEDLAPVLRNLERRVYVDLQPDSGQLDQRAVRPARLTEEDVADLAPRPPDADPADALAVAVTYASAFEVDDHAVIPTQADQRPLEPQSPEHYDRAFLEGVDCWTARGCEWLRTHQEITKRYGALSGLIPPITYEFFKDFRWVDLAADDDEPPRWAFVARTWNPDTFSSENGRNVIHQSYTLELWLPRDGRGFRWDEADDDDGDPAGRGDSTAGGTLRLLSLWTQTVVPLAGDDEALQAATIKIGVNDNFRAHESWLEARRE